MLWGGQTLKLLFRSLSAKAINPSAPDLKLPNQDIQFFRLLRKFLKRINALPYSSRIILHHVGDFFNLPIHNNDHIRLPRTGSRNTICLFCRLIHFIPFKGASGLRGLSSSSLFAAFPPRYGEISSNCE